MNKWTAVAVICLGAALVGNGLLISVARADEHREQREHREHRERREPERHVKPRFGSPHWVFDSRFHHRHYYPSVGYSLRVLPGSSISVRFGGRHLFFDAGVWFAPARSGYVVVAPPVGAIVPMQPSAYTPVLVNGVTYYYANNTFYAPTSGGFVVVAPPAVAVAAPAVTPAEPAPTPPPAVVQESAPSSSGVWYFCESSKTYYPYVSQCPEGWKTVPAVPPSTKP